MGLKQEIMEQPAVLSQWVDRHMDRVFEIAREIQARDPEYVFLAARGTSDHAGIYAQYLWGSMNRLPVASAAPSLFTLYGRWPRLVRSLVVGISQSGESPDIVSVVAEGRRQGATTLAITNRPDSPLGRAAEFVLDIEAGTESAVAATKTYTGELMAVAALSTALTGDEEQRRALEQVPEAVARALELDGEAERLAGALGNVNQCIVVGRGYNYATANEWALKLKELTYVFADAYSAADVRHGPLALVDSHLPVFAVAPSGAALGDLVALLERVKKEYDAQLFVISDAPQALALADYHLALPEGLPEWFSPIASIVPAQLFCYHLTRVKGYSTEAPRHIAKVTLTR